MAHLVTACPHMASIHETVGTPALRHYPAGFAGLTRIIVGQQLSVASARAIFARLESLTNSLTPQGFLSLTDSELKSTGLSAGKRRTCRDLAAALQNHAGGLPAGICTQVSPAQWPEIRQALSQIKGIGPWTLDIYEMFCLRHADAFASGDLALKEAVRLYEASESRPSTIALEARSQAWKPVRAVAAKALWADYAHRRSKRMPAR